jgi:ankyrin repeat protein
LIFYKKEHGLDLNGKNSQRQTLLMTAVANNSFGVVTYLLEQKVDLSPKADGLTALSLAVKQGSLRTTKMLVEHLEKNSDSKTIETALREAITVARKNKNATVLEFLEPRLSAIKKTTPASGF